MRPRETRRKSGGDAPSNSRILRLIGTNYLLHQPVQIPMPLQMRRQPTWLGPPCGTSHRLTPLCQVLLDQTETDYGERHDRGVLEVVEHDPPSFRNGAVRSVSPPVGARQGDCSPQPEAQPPHVLRSRGTLYWNPADPVF